MGREYTFILSVPQAPVIYAKNCLQLQTLDINCNIISVEILHNHQPIAKSAVFFFYEEFHKVHHTTASFLQFYIHALYFC